MIIDGIELFGPGPDGQLCENRHNLRKYVRGRVKWKTEIRGNITIYLNTIAETTSGSSSECVPSTSSSEYLPPATSKISTAQQRKPNLRKAVPKITLSKALPVTSEKQKKITIVETAKKKSELFMSDTVSETVTNDAEMNDFKLPPIMVTKKSPPKEKKKKINRSLNHVREDPLVALKKKPSKKEPIIYKKRTALTMAQEIPDLPQPRNKKRIEFSSSDFETPESSYDINRAGCSSEKFVKTIESQASDKSVDLFQPSTSAAAKEEFDRIESRRLKKKKKVDNLKTHDDNGLPVFSDNTPDPSQDTVPYQPVVSTEKREEISRPSRQLRRELSESSQSSEGPPSPTIRRDVCKNGKRTQWNAILVLSGKFVLSFQLYKIL